MWDDEINKRIKEAADQYHPGYNDDAWNKMEQMLDEHLPQQKNRRRIFYYFLLLAILICTGVYFGFNSTHKNEISHASSTSLPKNKETAIKGETNTQPVKGGITSLTEKNQSDVKNKSGETGVVSSTAVNKQKKGNLISINNERSSVKIFGKNNNSENEFLKKKNEFIKNKKLEKEEGQYTHNKDQGDKNQDAKKALPSLKITQITSVTESLNNSRLTVTSKNTGVTPKSFTEKKAKTQKDILQRFGISFSAGPDVSGVDLEEAGKVTLSYGVGLRYNLSDKISLRTGFYVSKKIYSAEKKYYNVSNFTSADYYYLQSVDANCNVYEIPITVSYNFNKSKNHSWFVSTGLSSYLMKKEDYKYYYKYPSGITDDKSWSISNRNQHYFSVLDISGGYEYKVNKKLTLSAEPYLKLPLAGIGDGKIKLKSGGILFSVTLHP